MSKLLISLLATILLPTAVNAETIWLVLQAGVQGTPSFLKIEVDNIEQ